VRAEKVVAALLEASAAVGAIVGTGSARRVYGGMAPQSAQAPLVIYTKAGATRADVLNPSEPRVVTALVSVLCVAKTYPQLKSLAEAVRLALNNRTTSTAIDTGLLEVQIEEENPDQYDGELDEHAQTWTFRVVHTE